MFMKYTFTSKYFYIAYIYYNFYNGFSVPIFEPQIKKTFAMKTLYQYTSTTIKSINDFLRIGVIILNEILYIINEIHFTSISIGILSLTKKNNFRVFAGTRSLHFKATPCRIALICPRSRRGRATHFAAIFFASALSHTYTPTLPHIHTYAHTEIFRAARDARKRGDCEKKGERSRWPFSPVTFGARPRGLFSQGLRIIRGCARA